MIRTERGMMVPTVNGPTNSVPAMGEGTVAQITIDQERIAAFCQAYHIRRLALFGSVLRPDFGPSSDIDILVDFHPDHIPGLFGIARMERELSAVLGYKVDLRTAEDLSRYFRQNVLDQAEVQYAER